MSVCALKCKICWCHVQCTHTHTHVYTHTLQTVVFLKTFHSASVMRTAPGLWALPATVVPFWFDLGGVPTPSELDEVTACAGEGGVEY
jgi:hypothetical protein